MIHANGAHVAAQASVLAFLFVACGGPDEGTQSPAASGAAGIGGPGTGGTAGSNGVDAGSPNGGTSGAGTSGATNQAGGGGSSSTMNSQTLVATDFGGCGLDAQGSIHCWGLAPAEWEIPAGPFVELDGEADTVCAVRADRTYTCFPQPYGMPADLTYVPQTTVLDVAAHRVGVCVIDEGKVPLCGQYSMATIDMTPPAGERLKRISVGGRFACGVRSTDGSAICWGDPGNEGECAGTPAVGQLDAPAGSFQDIWSGGLTTCAIDDAGTLTCWGAGQAGDDPTVLCDGFQIHFGQGTPPDGSFVAVDVDYNHTCAIRSDGTLACWGAGTTDSCTLETDWNCRQSLPPDGVFVSVATGRTHSCAMTADHKVKCWGNDGEGELGGRTMPPAVFQ